MKSEALGDVSRETTEKLEKFADLVRKWTQRINLIAPNTVDQIWSRHILDSAQVHGSVQNNWKTWVDLGSGGGFPGLVIAVLAGPNQHITLVESDARKSVFLRTASRELGLNTTVKAQRIEALNIPPSDVLSARALAPLPKLLGYCETLLKADGTALFPKGQSFQEELDHAQKDWQFDVDAIPSQTNADARLLRLQRITRREP